MGFDRPLGNLKINLAEKKVYWDGSKAYYIGRTVRKNGVVFFIPASQERITVGGNVDQRDKTAPVHLEDAHLPFGVGLTKLGRTKNGAGELLMETIHQLDLSENVIGLVAKTKYVDGNVVAMRFYEYVGNLKVDTNGCQLNGTDATVSIRQTADGARSLAASNGKNELVLWPNGGWLLYTNADFGVAVGGMKNSGGGWKCSRRPT